MVNVDKVDARCIDLLDLRHNSIHHRADYANTAYRVLLFFGTSGDIKYLRHMITQAHLRRKVVASKELVKDGWKVNYFTYKLY